MGDRVIGVIFLGRPMYVFSGTDLYARNTQMPIQLTEKSSSFSIIIILFNRTQSTIEIRASVNYN